MYQIPDKIFYKGNLNNTIFIDEDLFINDDILIYSTNEWVDESSKIVSFSILTFSINKIKMIRVFFTKNFIGKWTYEIVGTDILLQTATVKFNINVFNCAQTDWTSWNGPYQAHCLTCRDGYRLMNDHSWLAIDTTDSFESTEYIFIKVLVILNIVISIILLIIDSQPEIWYLVIYINQSWLIIWIMSGQLSGEMVNFLSILQLWKLDFKFLDPVFNIRYFMNSLFYKEQYTNMLSLNFESGSTLSNYSNFFILISFLLIIYLIGFQIK